MAVATVHVYTCTFNGIYVNDSVGMVNWVWYCPVVSDLVCIYSFLLLLVCINCTPSPTLFVYTPSLTLFV